MTVFNRIKHHLPRLQYSLGKRLMLGPKSFRIRGYHPDRLARDFDDEPHMVPVLKRVLTGRPGAFFDIGANCGQTLIKVLAVDPDRKYYGFEPQLECCFFIEHFLRANAIGTAKVMPLAMSNANGMVELFWDSPGDLTASILPSHAHNPAEIRPYSSWVSARRGDDLAEELQSGPVSAIKIDVEGFELEVLSGLAKTIEKYRPIILFEVLTNHYWGTLLKDADVRREKQNRADSIFSMLIDFNYTISRIDSNGEEHPILRFELDESPQPPFDNDGRDYIARPRD